MSLDHHQTAALIDLVRTVARAEIMPLFRNLPMGGIRAKTAPDDLVTQADVAAELALAAGIRAILPGAVVIGEEAVSANAAVLDRLAGADIAVIIDPIDGTWNYANGLTVFGVILAVVERGQTVWGLLYDPVMDDWVTASPGNGAWYHRPGAAPLRQRVSPQADLADLTGYLPVFQFPRAASPGWPPWPKRSPAPPPCVVPATSTASLPKAAPISASTPTAPSGIMLQER
ncbi:MAG: inositol monophosphatase family protein [Paracoccaceae bacterium]